MPRKSICDDCVKHRCILITFGDGPIPSQCVRFVKGPLVVYDEEPCKTDENKGLK